jgi:hypothetical protein
MSGVMWSSMNSGLPSLQLMHLQGVFAKCRDCRLNSSQKAILLQAVRRPLPEGDSRVTLAGFTGKGSKDHRNNPLRNHIIFLP